MKFYVRRR